MRLTILLLLIVMTVAACQSAEDRELAAFKTRLRATDTLSEAELSRLVVEVVRAIGGRTMRSRELGGPRDLDADTRAQILSILTGGFSIEDAGVRVEGNRTLRGLGGPGTPSHSEIDASQMLWVDIDTLRPSRYELNYSLPGYGDHGYDLTFE